MELDKLDRNILNILQTRADIPLKELAAQVHSSIATCQRRIKNLTEQGVIIRQAAIVSPQAVGLNISVFIQVDLERQYHDVQEAFERSMQREPQVVGCYEISGNYDFLLLVHCTDMSAYHAFTRRVLTSVNRVRNFKSQFVMNFAKTETKIEIPG
nr:Lrp/AsnC family transcriptional regulator [uncultured Neisseria sp.]